MLQRRRWIRFSRLAVLMEQSKHEDKRLYNEQYDVQIARAYRRESARSVQEAVARGALYANFEANEPEPETKPEQTERKEQIVVSNKLQKPRGRWSLAMAMKYRQRRDRKHT